MTAGELIAILGRLDPRADVFIESHLEQYGVHEWLQVASTVVVVDEDGSASVGLSNRTRESVMHG